MFRILSLLLICSFGLQAQQVDTLFRARAVLKYVTAGQTHDYRVSLLATDLRDEADLAGLGVGDLYVDGYCHFFTIEEIVKPGFGPISVIEMEVSAMEPGEAPAYGFPGALVTKGPNGLVGEVQEIGDRVNVCLSWYNTTVSLQGGGRVKTVQSRADTATAFDPPRVSDVLIAADTSFIAFREPFRWRLVELGQMTGGGSGPVSWNDLVDVPPGFNDSVDNEGTDDQTAAEVTSERGTVQQDINDIFTGLNARPKSGSYTEGYFATWFPDGVNGDWRLHTSRLKWEPELETIRMTNGNLFRLGNKTVAAQAVGDLGAMFYATDLDVARIKLADGWRNLATEAYVNQAISAIPPAADDQTATEVPTTESDVQTELDAIKLRVTNEENKVDNIGTDDQTATEVTSTDGNVQNDINSLKARVLAEENKVDNTGTDDQAATEVATNESDVQTELDAIKARLTNEEAKPDNTGTDDQTATEVSSTDGNVQNDINSLKSRMSAEEAKPDNTGTDDQVASEVATNESDVQTELDALKSNNEVLSERVIDADTVTVVGHGYTFMDAGLPLGWTGSEIVEAESATPVLARGVLYKVLDANTIIVLSMGTAYTEYDLVPGADYFISDAGGLSTTADKQYRQYVGVASLDNPRKLFVDLDENVIPASLLGGGGTATGAGGCGLNYVHWVETVSLNGDSYEFSLAHGENGALNGITYAVATKVINLAFNLEEPTGAGESILHIHQDGSSIVSVTIPANTPASVIAFDLEAQNIIISPGTRINLYTESGFGGGDVTAILATRDESCPGGASGGSGTDDQNASEVLALAPLSGTVQAILEDYEARIAAEEAEAGGAGGTDDQTAAEVPSTNGTVQSDIDDLYANKVDKGTGNAGFLAFWLNSTTLTSSSIEYSGDRFGATGSQFFGLGERTDLSGMLESDMVYNPITDKFVVRDDVQQMNLLTELDTVGFGALYGGGGGNSSGGTSGPCPTSYIDWEETGGFNSSRYEMSSGNGGSGDSIGTVVMQTSELVGIAVTIDDAIGAVATELQVHGRSYITGAVTVLGTIIIPENSPGGTYFQGFTDVTVDSLMALSIYTVNGSGGGTIITTVGVRPANCGGGGGGGNSGGGGDATGVAGFTYVYQNSGPIDPADNAGKEWNLKGNNGPATPVAGKITRISWGNQWGSTVGAQIGLSVKNSSGNTTDTGLRLNIPDGVHSYVDSSFNYDLPPGSILIPVSIAGSGGQSQFLSVFIQTGTGGGSSSSSGGGFTTEPGEVGEPDTVKAPIQPFVWPSIGGITRVELSDGFVYSRSGGKPVGDGSPDDPSGGDGDVVPNRKGVVNMITAAIDSAQLSGGGGGTDDQTAAEVNVAAPLSGTVQSELEDHETRLTSREADIPVRFDIQNVSTGTKKRVRLERADDTAIATFDVELQGGGTLNSSGSTLIFDIPSAGGSSPTRVADYSTTQVVTNENFYVEVVRITLTAGRYNFEAGYVVNEETPPNQQFSIGYSGGVNDVAIANSYYITETGAYWALNSGANNASKAHRVTGVVDVTTTTDLYMSVREYFNDGTFTVNPGAYIIAIKQE